MWYQELDSILIDPSSSGYSVILDTRAVYNISKVYADLCKLFILVEKDKARSRSTAMALGRKEGTNLFWFWLIKTRRNK